MSKNDALANAKDAKKDEFYTQYEDIQREVNAYLEYNPDTFREKTVLLPCDDPEWSNFTRFFAQNFEKLGLKKLISTSYATAKKSTSLFDFPTDFEAGSPNYNAKLSPIKGKIFTLTRESKKVDINDLQWYYLSDDGDFRSDEVRKLRDEADIIVTNPPFSLFREFLAWIMEANKRFLVISHQNAITYKEVFPYIKNNKIWTGKGFPGKVGFFISPYEDIAVASDHREGLIRVSGVMWFTNLDHGRRHQPLALMTMADNLKFSKYKDVRENGYQKYDNYDAIEVPHSDAIPSDYDGVMGVPITFLDKYCPEQFEILGITDRQDSFGFRTHKYTVEEYKNANDLNARACVLVDGVPKALYARILIRKKATN